MYLDSTFKTKVTKCFTKTQHRTKLEQITENPIAVVSLAAATKVKVEIFSTLSAALSVSSSFERCVAPTMAQPAQSASTVDHDHTAH